MDSLSHADLPALALTVVYLTGDLALLSALEAACDSRGRLRIDGNLKDTVLERARSLLDREQPDQAAENLSSDAVRRLVNLAVGFSADDQLVSMLLEQAGFTPREKVLDRPQLSKARADFRVVIIGAGMSGIGAAVDLQKAGIPFTVLEKSDSVGGTWSRNTYPGCGVDTPSFFYSYSFAQKPDWSHYFPKRPEILEYFQRCVEDFDLEENIQFRTEVTSARFDDQHQVWRLGTVSGDGRAAEISCNAVITAVGQLNEPSVPDIPGLERFEGPVVHTAEWPQDREVSGERVALIGVGASAMQVGPAIVEKAEKLKVFQRQPHWILPNPVYHAEVPPTERQLHRRLPAYLRWKRLQMIWGYGDVVYPALKTDPQWDRLDVSLNAVSERFRQRMLRHIEAEVGEDPDLLAKVTPKYPPYGKRVLLDNHWYKMLKRDDVDLITSGIESVGPNSITTRDGREHEVDMIVLATGFQASKMLWPIDFEGAEGQSLKGVWGEDDPRAYLGITVPGFPNLFLIYGPNTNLAFGGSAIFNSECQSRYIVACLKALIENHWASLECKQGVHDSYNAKVDDTLESMVWARSDVSNWFRNRKGRVTTNMPWSMLDYWAMTIHPDLSNYVVRDEHGREIATEDAQGKVRQA